MEPERISFPATDYPVKVVARTADGLRERLDAIFTQHFGDLPAGSVSERPSAQSNFIALTYLLRVEHEGQLSAVHVDLKAVEGVLLVL